MPVKTEAEIRRALREWVIKAGGQAQPAEVRDDTPLIESRIISSLQVMDLLLFIERLSGLSIDTGELDVAVLRSIDTIYDHFFGARHADSTR